MSPSPEQPEPEQRLSWLTANLIVGLNAVVAMALGVGGGIIMVPLLVFIARMPIKRAAGTSLAVIVMVIAVGLVAQLARAPEDIHWDVALLLTAGSLVGSFVGKWLNKVLPENVFRYAFCAVLVVVSVRLLELLPHSEPLLGETLDFAHAGSLAYLLAAGVAAGVASSLFGLGGGVVVIPALAIGYSYFHDHFTATRATSVAMVLPTSLLGAILHWRAGNVDRSVATRTVPVAVVGGVAGVLLAYVVPKDTLRYAFAVLMILAAVRLATARPAAKGGKNESQIK